jgi:hypothetical protein
MKNNPLENPSRSIKRNLLIIFIFIFGAQFFFAGNKILLISTHAFNKHNLLVKEKHKIFIKLNLGGIFSGFL